MFLSAIAIEAARAHGLRIEPFAIDRMRPASYVLHLGNRFRRWRRISRPRVMWAPCDESDLEPIEKKSTLVIEPGGFALGTTIECIGLPADLAGQISPLSHVARFGLSIHCGADWINPSFGADVATALTLELSNFGESQISLSAGMPICHLRLTRIEGTAPQASKSVYEARDPLAAPRFYEEMAPRSRPDPNP